MKRVTLGDIASISSGGTPDRKRPEYWGGNVPWVKTGEIQFSTILNTEEKITDVGLQESSTKLFPAGTILMAMYGQGKTRGQVALLGIEAAINQACAAITPQDIDDSKYLFQYLAYQYVNIRRLSNSGSQENLNAELIRSIPIYYPSKDSRCKIADILTTWDDALEKLDSLIASKERRKKALMQQLLARSSARTCKGHALHRFGDLVERVTRRNVNGDLNVLTISAQDGLVNQQDYFNRNVSGADLSSYYLLKHGEFAYNRSSSKGYPYGALKRLDKYTTGVVSTLYLCFALKKNAHVLSNYLCHYFEDGCLNAGLRTIAKEGARAHGLLNVTADEFFDLDVFLPSLEEQRQIANILDTCNEELRLLRAQRTAIDQQKRGLMQKLLTGKVGDEEGEEGHENTDKQRQTRTEGMTMTDTGPIREMICRQAAPVSAFIHVLVGRCLSVSCVERGRIKQHERE
ncbi:MAG: restriction endonuclease subunit S [Victivallales bacterium]